MSAADIVSNQFNLAQTYAASATSGAQSFLNALNDWVYTPPQINVTWTAITAPTLDSLPTAPTMPTIEFSEPTVPDAFSEVAPTLEAPTFEMTAPTITLPSAPSVTYGSAPTIPTIASISVPSAPSLTLPDAPTLMSLNAVAFGGIDMHEDWLTDLKNVPTLVLAEPTPYSYALGPEYASALLTAMQSKLADRLNGGTGLPAAVEQALWDRARDREARAAQSNIDDILRSSDGLGFQLPAGVIAAQTREAQQNYYDKLSEASRDLLIKQADLEQANMKDAIAAGMQLEAQLVEYSYKLESLAFENAKAYASNAVEVYNARVRGYEGLLAGYKTFSDNYRTMIEGELAKVQAYKAQIEAEQAKAQVNQSIVAQYTAEMQAVMSQVEIFRAQVGAAQTLVSVEQTKIQAAAEAIRGYTAQVNAETAKVEAYKAAVHGEMTKTQVYESQVKAFATEVSAKMEYAKTLQMRYTSLLQAHQSEWEGYRARVGAETARMEALGRQSGALFDGYRATTEAVKAKSSLAISAFEANIKQYEASQNLALQTSKINKDFIVMTNNARLDAARTGAQVYSQLASSAYHMAQASASLNASAGTSVSYGYSGSVNANVTPMAAA